MKIQLVMILALSVISSHSGFAAGGISGGGGGTTIPDPISKEELVTQFNDDYGYGYALARTWFIAQQKKFLSADEATKASFATRIIFENPKDIFQVLNETKVELRMNSACLDFDGAEKEGSVRSDIPGAICLSPYLMAPKLSRPVALKEISALYVHEISHLLGADEAQAVAIQKAMLQDMMFFDFGKTVTGARMGSGMWGVFADWSHSIVADPDKNFYLDILDESVKNLQKGYEEMRIGEDFSGMPKKYEDIFMAYQALVDGVRDYACSVEPHLRDNQSEECARQIEKTFGNKDSVTAWEFLEARQGYQRAGFAFTMKYVDPSLKGFEIKRIHNRDEAVAQLKRLGDWVNEVQAFGDKDAEHVVTVIMN